jgi:hypothetical protein
VLLATTTELATNSSGMITINPVWVASILFSAVCLGFGWYIVRLDHLVEHLRDELLAMKQDIGKLQNADISCTNDQTILKQDMSKIRGAILKLITRKRLRKFLAAGASKSLPE